MPRIKLILSDIDSTILPQGAGRVSDRTLAAFHTALEAGIVIGPASGRGYAQIAPFFADDAACFSTAIATNGLEVYHGGERICVNPLPRAALEQTLEEVRRIPRAGLVYFDGAHPVLVAGERADLAERMPGYARVCTEASELPAAPVVKANVFVGDGSLPTAEFHRRLSDAVSALDFDIPLPGYLNIMPAGWNKGSAAAFLCEHLGLTLAETVVFGDAGNDLALFAVAGHPVAVANATPEAASAARWHIGPCTEDSVARAVESLVAGAWPFTR